MRPPSAPPPSAPPPSAHRDSPQQRTMQEPVEDTTNSVQANSLSVGSNPVEVNDCNPTPIPADVAAPAIVSGSGEGTASDQSEVAGSGNRSRTSQAWLFFEKKIINGVPKAVCKRCKNAYVARPRDGTSHLLEIRLAISDWLSSDNEIVRKMAAKMNVKYEKYWRTIHGVMGVATVLDPRYKLELLDFYFGDIYGLESETHLEIIRQLCYDLLNEYQSKSKRNERASINVGSSSPSALTGDGDDPLSRYDSYINRKSTKINIKSELDHYLDDPVLPRSVDFTILDWWRTNGIKYPALQLIARDIYAIPVSTVASESAFSTGGRLLSPHRSRLHPDTLEAIVCAQNWLVATMGMDGEISTSDDYSEVGEDIIDVCNVDTMD